LAEEGFTIGDVGESDYDDLSLALMYDRIKSMSLPDNQWVEYDLWTGQTEFNFIAQMTRVFCRMGMWSDDTHKLLLTVLCRLPCPRPLPGVIVVVRATPTAFTDFDRSWDIY
jgi:hypothetical protein